ncbi:alpha-mannosidase [Cryobacterium sp. 5B3]|uniref:alpha-mannosidase n=1 Tax=Cryobacterium sp. 5B3 TaxID=3048586 RepID=UPI002AB45C1D|nr:glycoside hydrolase family 38 C-terminal domain-containing protein [Cryobacterium sp. 5B3]MDY7542718.1 glycoside hydrolase family 38 C-terminal domain-containing protein [Cryobacterium sp. 5B3]MEB0274767.1 glycoside hydrolase family 38 C-terminal domain-containing protein [Cryobacterium sp. 5B3]
MDDEAALIQKRIDRFLRERLRPAVYRQALPLRVSAWVSTAPVTDAPATFAEAVRQSYTPFAPGEAWGRPWGTVWFHATGTIPADWAAQPGTRIEAVVDLGFTDAAPGFQAEGIAWTAAGTVIKGIAPRNRSLPLASLVAGGATSVDFYVEAAANPDVTAGFTFVPTRNGDPATADTQPLYRLRQLDLALRDEEVWELLQDVLTLDGLCRALPQGSTRAAGILRTLERCLDVLDPADVSGTAAAGRAVLAPALAQPATASAHRVHAVGHAHIDSAWLWPVRETVRKVARTFSNVLALAAEYPGFTFAASSAQQYAWLKEYYPELFERVRAQVAAGAFVPVGGMWVESDTNMPGGESLARQFMAGKRFFLAEFGIEPLEVWLPDSFGYSAALPQIIAAAGSRWFLTQKSSWNETNRMPHHTFRWEGIDGTRIFTHFPPVDTYSSDLSGADLARAETQYSEKGMATTSLVPFGWGDGGGGPTAEMIAAARRTASLEGSPAVELSTPRRFFEAAEAEYPEAPIWSGELYLEFHRGTYTSQARTKRGNRRSEHLLREAELWTATASIRTGAAYPYAALERAWQTVLLQQFHDILPGSSIAWVHQEAERHYAEVARDLEGLIAASVTALCGTGAHAASLNAGPYSLHGVPALGAAPTSILDAGSGTGAADAPATVTRTASGLLVLANALVSVTLDADGLVTSLRDLRADRELIPSGARGNRLLLHRDTPTQWDAWDIDAHYKRTSVPLDAAVSVEVVADTPAEACVRVTRVFGSSRFVEGITLAAGSPTLDLAFDVDWHERQKLLKIEFPFDVHAERAASEIQFGHVYRPTHANTSWDTARFETCAHRWVHVGEPGYGVAVANDSTYGHDIGRSTDAGGRATTTVRLSLLRAALFPDPEADQGRHTFRVAVRPGASIADAITEGYRLNLPLRTVTGVATDNIEPLLEVDNPAVVIEAVKLAEDRSGDLVVRIYEAHGSRARARVIRRFEAADAYPTDLLERRLDEPGLPLSQAGPALDLELRPFQLLTLRYPQPIRRSF